jgi:TolB-like protein
MTRINLRATFCLLAFALLCACTKQEASNTTSTAATATTAVPEKSIAILPFTDLSELGDQEYFAMGLSDDLINKLNTIPDLKVAGRDSSFYFKDHNQVLSEMGQALGVAYLLQGSVRKAGNALRVSAQLVKASDGFNLWSRTFDGDVSQLFTIQADIAKSVTTALSVTLGAGEFDRPGSTRNIDAYDAAMQAQAQYEQFTQSAVYLAINKAEAAVMLDPNYARGWLLLGSIYQESPLILSKSEAADFQRLATNAFTKARQLAPDMPELYMVAAGQMREDQRYQEAELTYQQYFEKFGTGSARANLEYAMMLSSAGRLNDALPYLQRAKQLEPLASRYSYQLALHLLYLNHADEARSEAAHGLTLAGGNWLFASMPWQAALHAGDLKQAAALIRSYYQSHTSHADATVSETFMLKLADILDSNNFAASTATLTQMINNPSVTPYELSYLAKVIALLHQPQVALNYWSSVPQGTSMWESYYREMRQLPEFTQLMQQKGLLTYWRSSGHWPDLCKPDGERVACQ